jgi:hypothetical protein
MSNCRRCNRPLKREPWATLGIGRICSAKSQKDSGCTKNENDTDEIIPFEGDVFFIERKKEPFVSRSVGGAMRNEGVNVASGVRTNIQRTVYKHSPTGFNFGYSGSGPADTALNLLLMVTSKEQAYSYYQDFKEKFIAGNTESDRLEIPLAAVKEYIKTKEKQTEIELTY